MSTRNIGRTFSCRPIFWLVRKHKNKIRCFVTNTDTIVSQQNQNHLRKSNQQLCIHRCLQYFFVNNGYSIGCRISKKNINKLLQRFCAPNFLISHRLPQISRFVCQRNVLKARKYSQPTITAGVF